MSLRKVLPLSLAVASIGIVACGKKESKKNADPVPQAQQKPRGESPKTMAEALEILKGEYCTLTLKNEIKDKYYDITLKAGSSHLVSAYGGFVNTVFAVDAEGRLKTVNIESADIAEATCYPTASAFGASELVYFMDTPIYDNKELKGEPKCVVPFGTKLQNNYEFGGGTVSFTELASICGGLTSGFEDTDPSRVMLKK